jgi:hypothetical protein
MQYPLEFPNNGMLIITNPTSGTSFSEPSNSFRYFTGTGSTTTSYTFEYAVTRRTIILGY